MSVSSGPVEKVGKSSKSTVKVADASPHDEVAALIADLTDVDVLVCVGEGLERGLAFPGETATVVGDAAAELELVWMALGRELIDASPNFS